ncbi:MAG TPA: branched chain amino acid aminotransferase [Syntrophaceae bacterium]|jgi:branched-chain amino acid aminotransferase|nr:branched chain amino acid aminotransferase [Syntrophaceae bacterium]
MQIKVVKVTPSKLKPKPADESKLGFGKIFTDHFFTLKYHADRGWYDAMIEPYRLLSLEPTAMCLHYGQEIFEGMKAYRGKDDQIFLFRPYENIKRMNVSAERLCMPKIDPEVFMNALKTLLMIEKDWIPRTRGASLYIRPTMIATEAALGVHDANEYLFFIVLGPVGVYYPQGFSPTSMYVTDDYVRAVRGGIGNIKAAGNYAASLRASKVAMEKGFTQVLWLDAVERKYIEEVGTSNIFFVIGNELVTPPLGGSILPGVTRDSVIQIARSWNISVSERPVSIDELVEASAKGGLKEAFASGTAAIVSPIGKISYKEREIIINDEKTGDLTEKLYNEILQIQYGEKDDPFGWRMPVSE